MVRAYMVRVGPDLCRHNLSGRTTYVCTRTKYLVTQIHATKLRLSLISDVKRKWEYIIIIFINVMDKYNY